MKNSVISSILKHDKKITSYKIALLRAINDAALSFPDLCESNQDVAVPLNLLSQSWIAYYWSFVNPVQEIFQGRRDLENNKRKNDMAFRPQLSELRRIWEQEVINDVSRPSDGFFLVNELRVPRKYETYPSSLHKAYRKALSEIRKVIEQPIKYAGPGEWTVFTKPVKFADISDPVIPIPETKDNEKCLIVSAQLWQTFQEMSLWIEALCIHEWCLFIERLDQGNKQRVDRCLIYRLLTDRPDNRRPLTWERNQVDLLLMENLEFRCPWTEKPINQGIEYHLDHLLPLSIYPINELWNLVPADPKFNSHTKRDLLPTPEKLQRARPHLELAYRHYNSSSSLSTALKEDAALRFSNVSNNARSFPTALAHAVVNLIDIIGESRNIARF